jgi:hypothetical protein
MLYFWNLCRCKGTNFSQNRDFFEVRFSRQGVGFVKRVR